MIDSDIPSPMQHAERIMDCPIPCWLFSAASARRSAMHGMQNIIGDDTGVLSIQRTGRR